MPTFESGAQAAVLLDGRDETRLNHSLHVADGREALEITTLQPEDNAKSFAYGLLSGLFDCKGFMSDDPATVNAQMATASGKDRDDHLIVIGPRGLDVGNEALILQTKTGGFVIGTNVAGITTADGAFSTTEAGILDGVALHNAHGAESAGVDQKYNLAASGGSITSPATHTIKDADGATLGTFDITLGDNAATVESAIEAVPGITSASVTGSSAAPSGGNANAVVADTGGDGYDGTYAPSAPVNGYPAYDGPSTYCIYRTAAGDPRGAPYQDVWIVSNGPTTGATVIYYSTTNSPDVPSTGWTLGAGSNVPTVTPPSAGSAGSADFDAEITAPANTRFTITTAATGWTDTETQQGGASDAKFNVETATGSGDWLDGGASSTDGYSAMLSVIELLGEDALLTVFVRHTDDNGSNAPDVGAQSTLVSFTAAAEKTAQLLRSASATVKRWTHCTWTLAGTTPQAVFAVALARN